jgi:hypothetical protein
MDFTDILSDHRIQSRVDRPGWINFRCFWCEKDPYLGYNVRGRYVNCWNCGRHELWEVVQKITGLPAKDCFALIDDLPRDVESWHKTVKVGKLTPPVGLCRLGEPHRAYLKERHFKPAQIVSRYEIKGIGIAGGHLKWRLYLPVFYRGEIVSWTTRAIGNRQPRYYSAKNEESAIPIENLLYGIDFCINAVVVVEGPLDAWAIGPGAVATMGLRTSGAQLEQLSRFPLRIIAFDSEPAAQVRARKLTTDLSVFDGKTINLILDTAKDAAAADKDEIESLRKEFLS